MLQPRLEMPDPKMTAGTVIVVYLHTEDERQIEAIAEAVADTLDLAAGRPKTSDDDLPYIVTVGPTEVPEEVDEFVKMAGEGKTIIICPRPISEDSP